RLVPAARDPRLNAGLLEGDAATGRATTIRPIELLHEGGASAARAASGLARRPPGDEAAAPVRSRARPRVERLRELGVAPRLALVSVGEDPASRIYLARKSDACAEVGIEVRRVELAAGTPTTGVVERVRALGDDPNVHGILVQLPLPAPAE